MAEINGIHADSASGFGLASINMKTRPDAMIDPGKTFAHLMEDTINSNSVSTKPSEQSDAGIPGIVPRQTHIDKTDELYEQCLELETFLVKNILNAMRKNVMKSSLIDTGYAGEIYEDMLWDEYAKEYTKNAGFGLADLAYLELTGQRGRKA